MGHRALAQRKDVPGQGTSVSCPRRWSAAQRSPSEQKPGLLISHYEALAQLLSACVWTSCLTLICAFHLQFLLFYLCSLTHPWTKASTDTSSFTNAHSSLHPLNTSVSVALLMLVLCFRSTRTSLTWAPYFSPKTPHAELINSFIPSATSVLTLPLAVVPPLAKHKPLVERLLGHLCINLSVPHAQPRAPEICHSEQILHFLAPWHVSCRPLQKMIKIDYTSKSLLEETLLFKM